MIEKQNLFNKKQFFFLFLIGSGSFGLSLFILYKYWKLKKLVLNCKKNVEKLSDELNLVKTKQIEQEKCNQHKKFEKRPIVRNSSLSSYKTPPTSPERRKINFKDEKYEILKEKFLNYQSYFQKVMSL